ncbi:MAG: hypothetical protein PWQ17_1236 [Anaerophaga sp.]|nr:hypothetical protein [Anaerophaga sp.]
MLSKMNIRTLSIVFFVLLVVFTIHKITEPKRVGNLPENLVSFVPEECDKIVISQRGNDDPAIVMSKEANGKWIVKSENSEKEFMADSSTIKRTLKTMSQLKPMRMATQSRDRWEQFEVTDSAGMEVAFYNDDNVLADLIIGRFTYIQSPMAAQMRQRNPYMRQNPGTMSTYIRRKGEDEVFAVEGFLSSLIRADVNHFRDKSLFSLQNDFKYPVELSFKVPGDSSFVLTQTDGQWVIGEVPADSAAVADYLKDIRNLKVRSFANNKPENITHKLTIKDRNGLISVIEAEFDKDSTLIMSSQHPDNWALDKNNYLFDKIFVSKGLLLNN